MVNEVPHCMLHSVVDVNTMPSGWIVVAVASTFLSCLLCIPPLILQVQARNTAVSVLIASVLTINALHFINALIWPTEDPTGWWRGQGLCDIEVKLRIGLDMTISGAIACVFRKLNLIVDPAQYTLQPSGAQTRNTIIFETIFCGVLPILRMVLSYVVQPDRYWVFGGYGCAPSVDTSWPSYALVLVWPLVVCLIALVYGGLAALRLAKHSNEMSKLLFGGQARANRRRTVRLYRMTLVLFLVNTPIRAFVFFRNMLPLLVPYSWSRIHPTGWAERIEMATFRTSFIPVYAASVTLPIILFMFLGCGPEAKTVYRIWLDRIQSHLWPSKTRKHPSGTGIIGLPATSSRSQRRGNLAHELDVM